MQAASDHADSATFLFADIAGFTALTEAHGDEEAAALVAEFSEAVNAELSSFGGNVRDPVELFAAVRTGGARMTSQPTPSARWRLIRITPPAA